MFWFVTILLIAMTCAGVIGLAIGIALLNFGEPAVRQHRTLRVVFICFFEILAGGAALAAVLTKVIDPLVALIVTLVMLLLVQIWLGRSFRSERLAKTTDNGLLTTNLKL